MLGADPTGHTQRAEQQVEMRMRGRAQSEEGWEEAQGFNKAKAWCGGCLKKMELPNKGACGLGVGGWQTSHKGFHKTLGLGPERWFSE